jgi:hypothetical protein
MRIMGLLGPRVNKFSIPSHHLKLLLLLRTYENDAPLGRDITTIKWLHKQVLWACLYIDVWERSIFPL